MREIAVWNDVYEEFLDYGLKNASAVVYTRGLWRFCKFVNVDDAYDLLKLGLDKIEELAQQFIRLHQVKLAPKYLNVVYCSIRRWCTIKELIKSAKMFKEIRFDKSSRKIEALTEMPLDTEHIKNGFKVSKLQDKIDWGLYGLCGIRPSIIPEIRVSWIFPRNCTIEDGKIRLVKPTILIIPRVNPRTNKPLKGNKGNLTFMVFIPSRLAELIELWLNRESNTITKDSKLSPSDNIRDVYYKIKQIYSKIGFKGRPYLLRSYADTVLDRITRQFNDEDFKEFLMGHKGKVSAIYQVKGLNEETEAKYRDMYVDACDNWINEYIFEQRADYERGEFTFKQFNEKLKIHAQQAFQQTLKSQFEQLYLEMQAKHNKQNYP